MKPTSESATITSSHTCEPPNSSTQILPLDTIPTISVPSSFNQPGENEVWLFDLGVNPEVITIKVGTTVTWTDFDTFPYTITSDEGLFLSPTLAWGSQWSFTFTETGDYRYHISDDMNSLVGEVIVS